MSDEDDTSPSAAGKAMLAFVAPYVQRAVHATAEDVGAARNLIGEYLTPVVRLLPFALKDIRSPEMMRSPRTTLKKQTRRFDKIFRRLPCKIADGEGLLQAVVTVFVREIFPRIPQQVVDDWRNVVTEARKQDEFVNERTLASMGMLFDDAIKMYPEGSRKILSAIDTSALDMGVILSTSALRAVEEATNTEDRAEAVMHVTKRVSEMIYRPYAKALYLLWGATKQTDYGDADYGAIVNNLVNQASFMTTYPDLLDPDAVLVRNSDAHDTWRYHYENDSVELLDRNKPSKTISVDDLLIKCVTMLEIAGVMFPRVIREKQLAPVANWLAGVESIWTELLSADLGTQRAALELLLESLQRFPAANVAGKSAAIK